MTTTNLKERRIGWIGAGRMGLAMATRLVKAGCDLTIYNRTRAKAEPLAQHGARIAERLSDLADRDIVFAIVSTDHDLEQVLIGPDGLVSGSMHPARSARPSSDSSAGGAPIGAPRIVVDCTSISVEASTRLREALAVRGVEFLSAPV